MTADDIIARLDLSPHPEGGWYRQTWIGDESPRASGTCIYFLLKEGERSHWHRVDATEIWHFYAGSPLILRLAETRDGPASAHVLGTDLASGEAPQIIVAVVVLAMFGDPGRNVIHFIIIVLIIQQNILSRIFGRD